MDEYIHLDSSRNLTLVMDLHRSMARSGRVDNPWIGSSRRDLLEMNTRATNLRWTMLEAVTGENVVVYSVLVVPTRRILGSPSFRSMTKLVWESLMAKELKMDSMSEGSVQGEEVSSQIYNAVGHSTPELEVSGTYKLFPISSSMSQRPVRRR